MILKEDNFNNIFSYILNNFKNELYYYKLKKTKEILNFSFELNDPTRCFITHPNRNLDIKYPLTEFAWYLKGDLSSKEIGKYASTWNKISNTKGNVTSNYGYYIWYKIYHAEGNYCYQWPWCIAELEENKESRRCVLNILSSEHKLKNEKDIPCTYSLQFFIRNNELKCIVNMRSCDVIYGLCNDIVCFSLIHQMMYNELKEVYKDLILGSITMNMASLHIYEKHYKYLDMEFNNFCPDKIIKLKEDFLIDNPKILPSKQFKDMSIEEIRDNILIPNLEDFDDQC